MRDDYESLICDIAELRDHLRQRSKLERNIDDVILVLRNGRVNDAYIEWLKFVTYFLADDEKEAELALLIESQFLERSDVPYHEWKPRLANLRPCVSRRLNSRRSKARLNATGRWVGIVLFSAFTLGSAWLLILFSLYDPSVFPIVLFTFGTIGWAYLTVHFYRLTPSEATKLLGKIIE
jgi:hypothetical protein